MTLDTTSYAFALKELYPDDVLMDMTYQNNPLLAMVDKDTNAGGEYITVPVIYGNPQGRSATFADAISNKGATAGIQFQLTRKSDYSIAAIQREVMLASKNDPHAFARASKVEIDGAFNTATRSLAKALYGDGSGSLGVIGAVSTAAAAVITLDDINDITNFEVGMVLECNDTANATSLRSDPATASVTAVDRGLGTITTDLNSTSTTDWEATDFLFQEGDAGNMLTGLAGWVPTTAPTSSKFFDVDRSKDTVRLGGVRHVGTAQSVEEAMIDLASKVGREGGAPDCGLLNNVQYRNLIKSLQSKVEYIKQGVTANVSFSGVRIYGGPVALEVYQDFNCKSSRGYALQKNTWKLYSINPAPHIFDSGNDQNMLREANADAYEVRCGYYAQLGCKAPGYNGVVTLAAAS